MLTLGSISGSYTGDGHVVRFTPSRCVLSCESFATGVLGGKKARIGIGLRRQLDVTVPHDFHRNTRGRTSSGQIGGQRVAERMEISSLVLAIDKFNVGCFQIGLERNH